MLYISKWQLYAEKRPESSASDDRSAPHLQAAKKKPFWPANGLAANYYKIVNVQDIA